ncbi:hypothetical protein MMC09_002456 [Bachmanniomyces sp. S44760]|nr:hypothetical protein [Bachmanniomyces sp. S44760]
MTSQPSTTPGPIVNGKPTTVTLYSPAQLHEYPHLTKLKDLINAAFNESNKSVGWIFPPDFQRLESAEQIFEEIGPEYFTYIVSSSTESSDGSGVPTLHASASARVYEQQGNAQLPDVIKMFKRQEQASDDKSSTWELKLLVTDPVLHKQGLASVLMNLIEAEVKKRFEEGMLEKTVILPDGESEGPEGKKRQLVFLLETLKEANYEFYAKRGWVGMYDRVIPAGVFEATRPFAVAYMEKRLV